MISIGNTIKTLRKAKGVTQEEVARELGVSYQAVSKYENEVAQPDISLIPLLAQYFGVTIDELFGYKLDALTNKEKFVRFMAYNQILIFQESGGYFINTENFSTNAQISKIGEVLADCICENYLEFDVLTGMAYHGISFSAMAASVLYNKYGKTINYCHARQNPDSRGRMICGHTLQAGERVVIVDDGVSTGQSVDRWIEETKKCVDINVVALVTVFARDDMPGGIGRHLLEEKYGMKVYSVISDQDIQKALEKGIVRR